MHFLFRRLKDQHLQIGKHDVKTQSSLEIFISPLHRVLQFIKIIVVLGSCKLLSLNIHVNGIITTHFIIYSCTIIQLSTYQKRIIGYVLYNKRSVFCFSTTSSCVLSATMDSKCLEYFSICKVIVNTVF